MIKPSCLAGGLFVAMGIAGFVHPRILMPAKTDVTNRGDQKVIIETRRIVRVPPLMSVCALVAGGGLILLSFEKR
jgi:hypothetical protein